MLDLKAHPRRKSFLIFGSPLIEEPEIQEVVDTLRSGWLSTGPKVGRFEEMFRSYVGCRYALALHSATAGLYLSMKVAGIRPGDEVITTPMTFAATANTIVHLGARPVFVDVDRRTMNIDPSQVEQAVTPKTRAIVPVHFAGRPCDLEALCSIARRHHLLLIDDAAHAMGAQYHGRKIGAWADLTVFSFYATKNLVTGEGGMVTTGNQEWAQAIETYALHGLSRGAWRRYSDEGFKHYEVVVPGFKYNMMDLQAALGLHQLPRQAQYLARRREIWGRYDEAFSNLPVTTPAPEEPQTTHARHLYTLLLDIDRLKCPRDLVQQKLHEEKIGTGIHFISLHLHPYYRDHFGFRRGDFPNAEYLSDRTISLPLSPKLTDEDVGDVVLALERVLETGS